MELPKVPSLRLDGKRALVTGGSSGIGLGCAVALADAGAHVVCSARRQDVLDAAVDAMKSQGYSAQALPMDIGDLDSLTQAMKSQPPFDIVVNSAGASRPALALDTTPQDYQSVMDINVRGAYFLSVGAAHGMVKAGKGGSIIHVSSQMGHVGGIDRTVYCASKHALEGMVKAMAIEWGEHNIRINTVCPTFVRTPMTKATFDNPERVAWIKSKIKLNRVGEIEDISGSVLYLASEASAMVTGTSVLIDGGWTAG